jgi:hypothetical protein
MPCDRLAGHSTGAPAGGTAGVSSHASTIHHVHARPTCFANSDDHVSCCWRGASGIACANDANVNAKASAINLVITSLQLPVTKRNKQIMASELIDLIQIKQGGL